jgi:N-acyl-D-aspartate/D-glutamate deacylase
LSRIVFHGGRVFDGTGAPLADADVAIEDGRILEVAPGLDGDDGIDCSGKSMFTRLFYTHVQMVSLY